MSEHKEKERALATMAAQVNAENQKAATEIAEATQSKKRCCLNCAHFVGDPQRLFNGSCHRYPPSVFPMQGPGGQMAGMNMWPPVHATKDLCGEFTPEVKIQLVSKLPGAP